MSINKKTQKIINKFDRCIDLKILVQTIDLSTTKKKKKNLPSNKVKKVFKTL